MSIQPISAGFVLALIVLVVGIVAYLVGHLTMTLLFVMVVLLAIARLL